MKKFVYAVGALVLVLAVVGGLLYARNERRARTIAETALNDFRSRDSFDVYKRRVEPTAWVEGVRTLEGDGAAEIRNASRKKIKSTSVDPDGVPEIALLEAAGARAKCNLTGGVIPVADNPFETEILAGSGLLALGRIMAAKARALETRGLPEDAQKELLLLLSVGDHLEDDCSLISLSLGLAMQETALEALHELYAGRGEQWAKEAARADELRASIGRRRKAISPMPLLMEVSLSNEGRRVLEGIAEDASVERAIRAEAIMALNAGHLFHMNRIALGPETERRTIVSGLRLNDPVLAEISAKAQRTILDMSFRDRRKAVSHAYTLQ